VIALFGIGACGKPSFTPKSNPPPGAVAEYFESSDGFRTVRITEGTAMAIECTDAKSRPCSFDGSASAAPDIASLRRAYTTQDHKLSYQGNTTAYRNRTLFVVAGHSVGKTRVTVVTGYGDVDMDIDVVPR
jgi:hypothetical protein